MAYPEHAQPAPAPPFCSADWSLQELFQPLTYCSGEPRARCCHFMRDNSLSPCHSPGLDSTGCLGVISGSRLSGQTNLACGWVATPSPLLAQDLQRPGCVAVCCVGRGHTADLQVQRRLRSGASGLGLLFTGHWLVSPEMLREGRKKSVRSCCPRDGELSQQMCVPRAPTRVWTRGPAPGRVEAVGTGRTAGFSPCPGSQGTSPRQPQGALDSQKSPSVPHASTHSIIWDDMCQRRVTVDGRMDG